MLHITSLLLLVGTLNAIVGLLVFGRNPKKLENFGFLVLSLAVAAWSIGVGSFLWVDSPGLARLWATIYYIAPLLLVGGLVIFASSFPGGVRLSWRLWVGVLLPIVISAGALALYPNLLFENITWHDSGKEVLLSPASYALYSLLVVGYFLLGFMLIVRRRRSLKGLYRKQANLFLLSGVSAAAAGVLFNLILPWLGNYQLIWIGPLATGIFIIGTASSIIRHKMFDIRPAIGRTVTYSLTISLLVLVYVFGVFGLAGVLFDVSLSLEAQLFIVGAMTLTSLAFMPLKSFFDQHTGRIFFHDNYNPQQFLSEVNDVVVKAVELDELLPPLLQVIDKYVRPTKSAFLVYRHQHLVRSDGGWNTDADKKRLRTVVLHAADTPQAVTLVDELGEQATALRDAMLTLGATVLIKLTPKEQDDDVTGYIILGYRRSGYAYTRQDVSLFEVIAKELRIAALNALQYEQIQAFNATLKQRVDAATRQLRTNNEKLKALDETKDDFISMASHQLRTPLTSIKGYLSMVLEGDAGKLTALQRQMLTQAFVSSQRMTYVISDLLNVSRLKTGKFVVELSPVNLADLVQQELAQLEETARARSITLRFTRPDTLVTLQLDETKTRQVIMNFVDNAIYYTPPGGSIEIAVEEHEKTVHLTVTDTGIGVPKAIQHRLFTKFYRAPNAKSARPDGTGLGLFMAKKAIITQGGAVIFKSIEGKGSTFGFSFPKTGELQSKA